MDPGTWYLIAMAVTLVAGYFLSAALRPKAQNTAPNPYGLKSFSFPTTSETRPVPVVWGTQEIEGANLAWYGDFGTIPLTKSVDAGKNSEDVIYGYKYKLGMHFVLCHGELDALLQIRANDKVAWKGSSGAGTIFIDKDDPNCPSNPENLFGGDEKEGGLRGQVDILSGTWTQARNTYLKNHIKSGGTAVGDDMPAFRGVVSLVFHSYSNSADNTGFYVGTSNYLKPFKFLIKRIPKGLGSDHPEIDGDANPAEMLYEAMTNAVWGAGMDADDIDTESFLDAADQLYTEGFGLSLTWDNSRTVEDICNEILKHICATWYTDPATGKRKIKLWRDDYEIGTLPVINEDVICKDGLESFARTAINETANEVRATYTEITTKLNNQGDEVYVSYDRTAIAQDLANVKQQGAIVSTQVNYCGITKAALAQQCVERDLRSMSYPLAKASFKANRIPYALYPGAPFVFSWEPIGIEQMAMRVMSIDPGTLTDNRVTINAIEDVFKISEARYSDPGDPNWEEPGGPPEDLDYVRIEEMPYLVRLKLLTGFADADCFLWIAAARNTSDMQECDIMSKLSGGSVYSLQGNLVGWTPQGTLDEAIGQEDTSIIVAVSGMDLSTLENPASQASGDSLFLLDNELISYGSVVDNGDGTVTMSNCWRGMLDTTPVAHSAGARMYFVAAGYGITGTAYDDGDTVNVKLLPTTGDGQLPEDSATAHNITMDGRALKPYPPGAILVNGESYPEVIEGEMVLGWAHRDRTQQTAGLVQQGATSIGPESGVTYTLRIYGEDDSLLRTETGLTGTSYTYTEANELSDNGLGRLSYHLRIQLEAVRSGITSHQYQEREFDRPEPI